MARIARIVIPGLPHHITHRGNRRDQVFFDDSDYALYRDLVFDAAERAQTKEYWVEQWR
jgi:putative transposase